MQVKTSIKTIVALGITLVLTSCATTSPNNSSSSFYKFPAAIEDGYWAMIGDVDGEYAVIDFKKNVTNNYRFKCDEKTHTYKQIGKETYTLKPSVNAMQLVHNNDPAFATLKVARLEPKKVLFLNQSFPNSEMQKALPDGIEFAYIYTDTLKPLCGS